MKPPRIGWAEDEPPGSSDPHERIDLIGAAPRPALLAIDETTTENAPTLRGRPRGRLDSEFNSKRRVAIGDALNRSFQPE